MLAIERKIVKFKIVEDFLDDEIYLEDFFDGGDLFTLELWDKKYDWYNFQCFKIKKSIMDIIDKEIEGHEEGTITPVQGDFRIVPSVNFIKRCGRKKSEFGAILTWTEPLCLMKLIER
jgi:hypothetical protein